MIRDRSRGALTAKSRVEALVKSLGVAAERDPEQEVQGIAVPVLDAALGEIKGAPNDDPVALAVQGVISPDVIALGEAIRAVDALLVDEQLDAAIGPPTPS